MKKILTIAILLFSANKAVAQFPVHPDTVYTFIKYNSVWRNTITDWQPVDAVFKKEIAAAKSEKDTVNCFISVLKKLNDVHSFISCNGNYYSHYIPADSITSAKAQPLLAMARKETGIITTQLLLNRFVYIRVPAINAYTNDDINRYAQALYDSIYQYFSKRPKGFIIDLRLNTGGNLYPMLAGLSTLFGDAILGYEMDIDGSIARKWETKNGNFIIGGYQATNIRQPYKAVFKEISVAVITSQVTMSSGSMTAIAFKHRPRTFFIGEPTANGYTTSNGYFQFAPNFTFMFATNFVADRNKIVYKNFVPVDVLITKPGNFADLLKDESVKTAIKWLKK